MITFSKLGEYGRLGNQLWQIASTVGIAVRNGHKFVLPYWKYREDFPNIPPEGGLNWSEKVEEIGTSYHDYVLHPDGNWDLYGYFQSYKYFSFCNSMIRYYFDFKHTNSDGVAIHVRRGDYLGKQNVHPVLPVGYYLDAMKHFKGEQFTVFSDDIDWCKANLDGKNVTFHKTKDDITDFKTMRGFSKFIIANSSYSWWAAYLSKSKEIIAPSVWVHGEDRDDRVPPDWIRI